VVIFKGGHFRPGEFLKPFRHRFPATDRCVREHILGEPDTAREPFGFVEMCSEAFAQILEFMKLTQSHGITRRIQINGEMTKLR
jgi:hypothetical protein